MSSLTSILHLNKKHQQSLVYVGVKKSKLKWGSFPITFKKMRTVKLIHQGTMLLEVVSSVHGVWTKRNLLWSLISPVIYLWKLNFKIVALSTKSVINHYYQVLRDPVSTDEFFNSYELSVLCDTHQHHQRNWKLSVFAVALNLVKRPWLFIAQ